MQNVATRISCKTKTFVAVSSHNYYRLNMQTVGIRISCKTKSNVAESLLTY